MMPNWCENYVVIKGKLDDLKAIEDACRESKLLEHFSPIGEWDYSTAVEAWGTKWEPQHIEWELDHNGDDSQIKLTFDSAWGPPVQAYYTAEENLEIFIEAYFIEEGMGFVGKYEDGTEETYELDYETGLDDIPDHIIEAWALDERRESWLEWNSEEENENV